MEKILAHIEKINTAARALQYRVEYAFSAHRLSCLA
jgi:hypothetical protein